MAPGDPGFNVNFRIELAPRCYLCGRNLYGDRRRALPLVIEDVRHAGLALVGLVVCRAHQN